MSLSSLQIYPATLFTDIFSKLPVKSLTRFKCVSKSMHAFLHHPRFIKKHLKKTIQFSSPNLILKLGFKLCAVEDESWSKARRLPLPFAFLLDTLELAGSCSGLLCLSDHRLNEDIYLHNSSTGIYRKLPLRESDIPATDYSCSSSLGFGYLDLHKDYKVIRCLYRHDKPFANIDSYQCKATVYSFKTDTWRKIRPIPFHINARATMWFDDRYLVWTVGTGFRRNIKHQMISFDMASEQFIEVPCANIINKEENC